MWQLLRSVNFQLYSFLSDVIGTATSRERLRQLFNTSLYSNALYLMIANSASSLLGFVFWIIAARFYSTEDVGFASAVIAAVGFVALFAHLGIGMGLVRFLSHSGENANSMLNTAFTIGVLSSIAVAVIFVAGLGLWSPSLLFLRQDPAYLVAFIIFAIAYQLSYLMDEAFIAERRAGFVAARNIIFSLLKIPLPILLAALLHSFGIFASWGISLCAALLLCFLFFLPRAQPGYRPLPTINREVVSVMSRFSFANYLSVLFWSAPTMVMPIMVVNLLGAVPNAYFYIAWIIGTIPNLVSGAVSSSLFAEGSHEEEELGLHTWRSLKMVLVILVPTVILILAIADKLLLLFGGAYAENATTLLRILAISALPFAINITYLSIKRVEKKLKALVGLTTFTAAVTLVLTYLLLPWIGINGAGIAWLATQGIVALMVAADWLGGKRLVSRVRAIMSKGEEV